MKLNYVLFGLLLGSIGGYFAALYAIDWILVAIQNQLELVAVIGISAIVAITIIFIIYERVISFIFSGSKTSFKEIFDELANEISNLLFDENSEKRENFSKALRAPVAIYATWATRALIFRSIVGTSVVFAGALATVVLIKQNNILTEQLGKLEDQNKRIGTQNDLLETQNKYINQQMLLQQADRYLPLKPLVSAALEEISNLSLNAKQASTDDQADEDDSENYFVELPEETVSRIISILNQLGPYSYIKSEDPSKIGQDIGAQILFLSPERGQILRALFFANVNLTQFAGADFSYADMRNVVLASDAFANFNYHYPFPCGEASEIQNFSLLNLENSDFSGATLGWAHFSIQEEMRFSGIRLEQSVLEISDKLSVSLKDTVIDQTAIFAHSNSHLRLDGAEISTDVMYLDSPCIGPFYNADTMEEEEIASIDVSKTKIELFVYDDDENIKSPFIQDLIQRGGQGPFQLTDLEVEKFFKGQYITTAPRTTDLFLKPSVKEIEAEAYLEMVDSKLRSVIVEFK